MGQRSTMKHNRRTFMKSAMLTGLGSIGLNPMSRRLSPASASTKQADRRRLNVLLLLTDDQGAHLGCLATRGLSTPHIDTLAGQGVLFRNAFSTCASCSPARSGILTGMYPHSNGHWRNTRTPAMPGNDEDYTRDSRFAKIEPVGVHEDVPTLIEVLNSHGYVTGITQKFHLSPVWKYPFDHRLRAGSDPSSHAAGAAKFFDAAGDKPFFLLANIGNTHRPFKPHIVDIESPPVDPDKIDVPANLPDTPLMRSDLAEYLTTVQCADACVGAILKALKESGKYDRTLIIFTSDQGYCYHRAKATAYDAGIRVPLIVTAPSLPGGIETDKLVSHIDLMPTILDYTGITVPGSVQGRTLRPLLEQGSTAWRRYVCAEHNAHGPNPLEYYPTRSVFDGRLHYLRNLMSERSWDGDPASLLNIDKFPGEIGFAGPADAFPGGQWDNHSYEATVLAKEQFPIQYDLLKKTFNHPAEELYDLHHDPTEIHNLADDPRYSHHLSRLRKACDAWMQETNDPGVRLRDIPRR